MAKAVVLVTVVVIELLCRYIGFNETLNEQRHLLLLLATTTTTTTTKHCPLVVAHPPLSLYR